MRTRVTVRVKTKDAKFLGSSLAGAFVTLCDAWTGEVLASGRTYGTTGSTDRIVLSPQARGERLSDEGSAKFEADLDLREPRQIEVTAFGPLGQLQSANRAASRQWVIPGKHVTGGDGWMLELPGIAVGILHPPAHSSIPSGEGQTRVRANIIMM